MEKNIKDLENAQIKRNLIFELLRIQKDIHDLQFSLNYNNICEENPKYYLNKLISTIKESTKELKQIKKSI